MSVIVTFTVPGGDVALGRALSPTMRAELDRVVPVGDAAIPYVWITASDENAFEKFEAEIEADDAIEALRLLDSFGDRRLYRFRWTPGQSPVFDHLEASEAALLDASGDDESWTFKLRFPDQEELSEFYQGFVDGDLDIEITGVSDFVLDETDHGLSEQQRETLLRALESGFYNIPRDTTTVDFAGELGISDQSLSERLRRAHATLIENALR